VATQAALNSLFAFGICAARSDDFFEAEQAFNKNNKQQPAAIGINLLNIDVEFQKNKPVR
jgi:hypothetical protein